LFGMTAAGVVRLATRISEDEHGQSM
jgi:hypothetical protein